MVLITLVLWCVVVTGVNLVICEKGGDWFREMMGVKMGGRCVVVLAWLEIVVYGL